MPTQVGNFVNKQPWFMPRETSGRSVGKQEMGHDVHQGSDTNSTDLDRDGGAIYGVCRLCLIGLTAVPRQCGP